MASATSARTCEPPALSKKAKPEARAGKRRRAASTSNAASAVWVALMVPHGRPRAGRQAGRGRGGTRGGLRSRAQGCPGLDGAGPRPPWRTTVPERLEAALAGAEVAAAAAFLARLGGGRVEAAAAAPRIEVEVGAGR